VRTFLLAGHKNSYISKKAALCSIRIIKKVPELSEGFVVGWCCLTLSTPTGQAHATWRLKVYAVLVGGANGDGAWRGLVTLVESIDPRPYIFQPAVCGRLLYTVIHMSDRLSTPENANHHLTHPPDLRSQSMIHCIQSCFNSAFNLRRYIVEGASALLTDRHHGVLLCAVSLALQLCLVEMENIVVFRRHVITLVRILKSLIHSGYSAAGTSLYTTTLAHTHSPR
jgi:hypothetical protein